MNAVTAEPGQPASTRGEDTVFAALGLVVVSALHADGRAHILDLPDSFFSPWHAFLYGGLFLTVAWLAIMCRRVATRRADWRFVIAPAGYGYAIAGAAVFAIGGVVDMLWHIAFGIEFGIDALLSPSHLLLFVGGGLLLSGPLVAYRRRGESAGALDRAPAVLALLGITAVAAFTLSFLSAFISDAPAVPVAHEPEGTEAHRVAESIASAGLGSFVITSLLLVVPAVYVLSIRLWLPGALTVLVSGVAAGASALIGFQHLQTVLAAFVSAAILDLLVLGMRSRFRARTQELAVAAGLPLLLWSGQLIARSTIRPLGWSPEMAIGVILLCALLSFAAVLAVGARRAPR